MLKQSIRRRQGRRQCRGAGERYACPPLPHSEIIFIRRFHFSKMYARIVSDSYLCPVADSQIIFLSKRFFFSDAVIHCNFLRFRNKKERYVV